MSKLLKTRSTKWIHNVLLICFILGALCEVLGSTHGIHRNQPDWPLAFTELGVQLTVFWVPVKLSASQEGIKKAFHLHLIQ